MNRERVLEKDNIFIMIEYLKKLNIDNGETIRMKRSRKDGEIVKVIYYKYLDLYIVNNKYFTNQLKSIDYFNKL